jgi:hypothetical protein
MNSERQSFEFEAIRDDTIAAVADLRAVARIEHDERRNHTADWLDGLFADVIDASGLREAAAEALTLFGGAGSFADVGSAESARVVDKLAGTLEPGRSWSPAKL